MFIQLYHVLTVKMLYNSIFVIKKKVLVMLMYIDIHTFSDIYNI